MRILQYFTMTNICYTEFSSFFYSYSYIN